MYLSSCASLKKKMYRGLKRGSTGRWRRNQLSSLGWRRSVEPQYNAPRRSWLTPHSQSGPINWLPWLNNGKLIKYQNSFLEFPTVIFTNIQLYILKWRLLGRGLGILAVYSGVYIQASLLSCLLVYWSAYQNFTEVSGIASVFCSVYPFLGV